MSLFYSFLLSILQTIKLAMVLFMSLIGCVLVAVVEWFATNGATTSSSVPAPIIPLLAPRLTLGVWGLLTTMALLQSFQSTVIRRPQLYNCMLRK